MATNMVLDPQGRVQLATKLADDDDSEVSFKATASKQGDKLESDIQKFIFHPVTAGETFLSLISFSRRLDIVDIFLFNPPPFPVAEY